jgi:hypothetical protein
LFDANACRSPDDPSSTQSPCEQTVSPPTVVFTVTLALYLTLLTDHCCPGGIAASTMAGLNDNHSTRNQPFGTSCPQWQQHWLPRRHLEPTPSAHAFEPQLLPVLFDAKRLSDDRSPVSIDCAIATGGCGINT